MDLKQLKYFLAIAEEGQITAAANRLHISQPPLSYQLKSLEEELGVTLVKRGPHNVTLTGAGELLKKRAEQILDFASSIKREVSDYGKGLQGVLSIGTISSSNGVIPNSCMLQFTKNYPDIHFEIYEGNTYTVIDMLERGTIELGIVRTPFKHKMLNFHYLEKEPMVAVMTDSMGAGEDKSVISLEDLRDKPIIMYRRFNEIINDAFSKRGIEPFICCKNDDARTTIQWAKAGLGIGIVPKSALLTSVSEGIIFKEIECEELKTRLAIVWIKDRYLSPLGQQFIDFFDSSRT